MNASETSLRVVVRARPMNTRETREGAGKCVEYYENTGQIVINGAATFAYDKVFPDTVDQETVYESTAKPLLDRVFAGFNATVLAYGQTGSGKTYTMGTEDNDDTDEIRRGIIPRLVDTLFNRIQETGIPEAFKVTVSMYEVYSESVFDLLRPDKVKLNVHGDERNCTIVNLSAVPVTDLKGALKQLATGCHYRTKGETAMNATSSRSHAVFTIFLEKTAVPDNDQSFSAKLQLVDLAGSERLKKTEAEGNRMKEGININSGLLILSQVIAALATKQKHIPYRNSVITRVLQDSLGGNSFTVFLACISPADTNAPETLNTLRYADRAKQIKNKPIMNKNPKAEEIAVLQAQIRRLQKENEELKNGIAPADKKANDFANSSEISSLKDELARKDENLREKCMQLSDYIIKTNNVTRKCIKAEEDKTKLAAIISDLRNVIQNDEMMDPSDVLQSIQQLLGAESELSLIPDDENGEDTQVAMDDTVYDTERLPELQAQIDQLDKEIEMKNDNREKDLKNQKEFIEAMQQKEEERTQLAMKVGELETEITKLRTDTKKMNTASKLAEERRQKLKELEKQHADDKKTLLEFKKLQELRRKMEENLKKTEEELKNLKNQRLRLIKEQRAEASKFNAYKQKHEREMQQIKSKMQKKELDATRQKRIDEQRFAVLQQRLAESNRANKALKELNLKRANRKENPTDASTLQNLISEELELEDAAHRCHNLYVELTRQRTDLQRQIDREEAEQFETAKKDCTTCKKRRRLSCSKEDFDNDFDSSVTMYCDHDPDVSSSMLSRRMSDLDVSIVYPGEEEFETNRQKKLAELRVSKGEIDSEIKDLLKNSTISEDAKSGTKSAKWEKLPADFRPILDMVYNQALIQMKKSIDLEFQMNKQKNDFTAKLEVKAKQEEKRRRDDQENREKLRELTNGLEAAKSELHSKISFVLQLVKPERVIDESALKHFETLKNQFCDMEQKIKKASRRRTTNYAGGLTPKVVLQRNERNRRAVCHFGEVVNSADLTLGDRHEQKRKPAKEVNKVTDEFVKKRVAMSPIKLGDDTRLSEGDESMDAENLEPCNATFVRNGSESPMNGTFVISGNSAAKPSASEEMGLPPMRKSRRTDLGPI